MTIKAAFAYPDPDTKEGSVDRVCVQVLIFLLFNNQTHFKCWTRIARTISVRTMIENHTKSTF